MLRCIDERIMPVMVIIPARGGSKGIPRKALETVGGKSLIEITVEYAKTIRGVDEIVVSTDSEEIRAMALSCGAQVPFLRPPDLATDYAPLSAVIQHALNWYEKNKEFVPRVLVTLHCTHPFRRRGLVDIAIRWGIEDPRIVTVQAFVPIDYPLGNIYLVEGDRKTRILDISSNPPECDRIIAESGSFHVQFPGRDFMDRSGKLQPFVRQGGILLEAEEVIDVDEISDLEYVRKIAAEGNFSPVEVKWGDPSVILMPQSFVPKEFVDFSYVIEPVDC